MSFHDLPPAWAERRITDPDLFGDAVDLFATDSSRRAGCLYVLLCNDAGQVMAPVAIDEWDFDETPGEQHRVLTSFLAGIAAAGVRHVVAIIARRGHPAPTGNDHQFAQLLRDVAAAQGQQVDGLATATPLGVRASAGDRLPSGVRGTEPPRLSA